VLQVKSDISNGYATNVAGGKLNAWLAGSQLFPDFRVDSRVEDQ